MPHSLESPDSTLAVLMQNVPQLLRVLEVQMAELQQAQTVAGIAPLSKTIHQLAEQVIEAELAALPAIAHRFEQIMQALGHQSIPLDLPLKRLLSQAGDCLRLPLTEQLVLGEFDAAQTLSMAEPILSQLETRLQLNPQTQPIGVTSNVAKPENKAFVEAAPLFPITQMEEDMFLDDLFGGDPEAAPILEDWAGALEGTADQEMTVLEEPDEDETVSLDDLNDWFGSDGFDEPSGSNGSNGLDAIAVQSDALADDWTPIEPEALETTNSNSVLAAVESIEQLAEAVEDETEFASPKQSDELSDSGLSLDDLFGDFEDIAASHLERASAKDLGAFATAAHSAEPPADQSLALPAIDDDSLLLEAIFGPPEDKSMAEVIPSDNEPEPSQPIARIFAPASEEFPETSAASVPQVELNGAATVPESWRSEFNVGLEPPELGQFPAAGLGLEISGDRLPQLHHLLEVLIRSRAALSQQNEQVQTLWQAVQRQIAQLESTAPKMGLDALRQTLTQMMEPRSLAQQMLNEQQQALNQLQQQILEIHTLALPSFLERFTLGAQQLAMLQGKTVQLQLEGLPISIDRTVLEALHHPLLQLLRYSVASIEGSKLRQQRQKPEVGQLKIRARQRRMALEIELQDDGQGLDAVDQSMIQSGLQGLPGRLTVQTQPGQGTCFKLQVPLSLCQMSLLLCQVNQQVWAFPAADLQHIAVPTAKQLEQLQDQQRWPWKDQMIPVHRMQDLLSNLDIPSEILSKAQLQTTLLPESWAAPLLILKSDQQPIAFEVEALITQQDYVIQPYERAIASPAWINGYALLDDGTPIPVIDGAALLEQFQIDA